MDYETEFFDESLEEYIPILVSFEWREYYGNIEITGHAFFVDGDISETSDRDLAKRMGKEKFKDWLNGITDDAYEKISEEHGCIGVAF